MGHQVTSKMCACFLCIMRRQFEDLFICEKRHPKSAKKARAKIGTLNLQNEAVPMCKNTTRKNWHLKSAKRGSAYVQKNYAQKLAP